MQLIKLAFIFGILLTSVGLYLLMFTAVSEKGMNGLLLIVGLLTAGLLLLIPAKVYLIITLMNRTRQSKR
jgi:hypothetical protein